MIRWCSFCQKYMGECEPTTNLSMTHGICTSCIDKPKTEQRLDILRPILDFYSEIAASSADFNTFNLSEIVSRAKKLRVKACDLFVGVMIPLFAKISDPNLPNSETLVKNLNPFTDRFFKEIISQYNIAENHNDDHVDILCTAGNEPYPYASIRCLYLFLRPKNYSIRILPDLDTKALYDEHLKQPAKVLVVSAWKSADVQSSLEIFSPFKQTEKPPLVIFDYSEVPLTNLPSYAIAYNGDLGDLESEIKTVCE